MSGRRTSNCYLTNFDRKRGFPHNVKCDRLLYFFALWMPGFTQLDRSGHSAIPSFSARVIIAPYGRSSMQHALAHLKQNDQVLGAVIERVGPYSMEFREPTFDTLVRSIVFQQISGAAGRTVIGRLQARMPEGRVTPEAILRLRVTTLRKCGLSGQKTQYIRDLARHASTGELAFDALAAAPDHEVIDALTRVRGIGVWTAQMFLMFALARPDVLPTGDLGIRKAMQICYQLPGLPNPAQMEQLAKPWRPYCSVACWYLWRSLDGIAAL
jgi:DNA-3-methyladenine glycosylase II